MVFHLQPILMETYEKKTAPKSKTPQVDVVLRLESCFTIFWCLFPPCTVTSFCAPAQWVNSTYTFYIYSAKLPKIVALFAVFAPKPTPNKVPKKNRRKIDGQNEHHDQLTVFGGKVLWPRERGKRMLQNLFRTNDSATNKSSMNQLLPTRASNQSASVQSELHQALPSQTVFHVIISCPRAQVSAVALPRVWNKYMSLNVYANSLRHVFIACANLEATLHPFWNNFLTFKMHLARPTFGNASWKAS